ncbi:MAG: helix-turn-helix domain-containing protein [Oscillospiraceae bacterium]|nr:helix-turn-helix domain-containing protein [Oscillospiraceae bacterium]
MIKLRDYRLARGLTMKELGEAVGVSESAVGLWETGRRKPNYEKLLRLAELLDCSVNELLGQGEERAAAGESVGADEALPEITMIARAGRKMSPERRQDMIKLLRIAFPEEFRDE